MRYFPLISLLLLSNYSNAQWFGLKYKNIEPAVIVATYSLKYQQDSTNPNNIRTSAMLLFLGKTMSKYVNSAVYINDTAERKFTSINQIMNYEANPQNKTGGVLYQIYKNYPKGKLTFTDHIPPNTYRFEETLNLFQWELTGNTATICGFKAQSAKCNFGGRSWIAWYSPDLPYNDGPYKFNGLPGLIVKVSDTRNHYIFELMSIGKPRKSLMIDMEDKDYLVTTKQGFFRAQDSFREDIVNRAKEVGGDNMMQQTAAKNMSQRNNPIELLRK